MLDVAQHRPPVFAQRFVLLAGEVEDAEAAPGNVGIDLAVAQAADAGVADAQHELVEPSRRAGAALQATAQDGAGGARSDKRRVGKERVSTRSSCGTANDNKTKTK